jgi:hypothetical protein
VREFVETRLDDVRTDETAHRLRLQTLIPSLVEEFGDEKPAEEIRACADVVLAEFADVPVRRFVLTRIGAPANASATAAARRSSLPPSVCTPDATVLLDGGTGACQSRPVKSCGPSGSQDLAFVERGDRPLLHREWNPFAPIATPWLHKGSIVFPLCWLLVEGRGVGVGFANSGGLVFVDESAEEIAAA